jgi:hypothetical protein
MKAAVFCEDNFDACYEVTDEAAFAVFAKAFTAGANAYGAGNVRLYLLPRHHAAMVEAEHIGEVMRAVEAAGP